MPKVTTTIIILSIIRYSDCKILYNLIFFTETPYRHIWLSVKTEQLKNKVKKFSGLGRNIPLIVIKQYPDQRRSKANRKNELFGVLNATSRFSTKKQQTFYSILFFPLPHQITPRRTASRYTQANIQLLFSKLTARCTATIIYRRSYIFRCAVKNKKKIYLLLLPFLSWGS